MSPIIEIKLEHHFAAKIYTTGSSIRGYVAITTDDDLPVDRVDICFVGVVRKRIELYRANSPDETFLIQRMPLEATDLPENKIFTASKKHHVPFHFIIPERLTTEVCQHPCSNELRDRHLQLPPTMGFWDGDNMCPDTTSIGYYVWAGLVRESSSSSARFNIAGAKIMLKVLPVVEEDAPPMISQSDKQFALMARKDTSQGFSRCKEGELLVVAFPPSAVMLSEDGHRALQASVRLSLEFRPSSEQSKLPTPKAFSSKIVSNTYYGPSKLQSWPHLGNKTSDGGCQLLNYTATYPIKKRAIDIWEWRKASNIDTEPSKKGEVDSKFVSEVDLPLNIPHQPRRFFIPTFHSCHISRTYTLQLSVHFNGARPVSLSLPIQVGVESTCTRRLGEYISGMDDCPSIRSSYDRLPKYEDVL